MNLIKILQKIIEYLFPWLKKLVVKIFRQKLSPKFHDDFSGKNDLSIFNNLIEDRLKYASGRKKEMQSLLDFIDSEKSGIVLIEGYSGYGKTTFLSQLKKNMEDDKKPLIWHYFSKQYYSDSTADQIRFDNNISEQLIYLLNKKSNDIKNTASFVISSLKKSPIKNLVILIDAIDETDPSFLQTRLPSQLLNGLKIIITCRTTNDDSIIKMAKIQRGNLALGLTLQPLDIEDIKELMLKMDIPTIHAKEIIEISKGDPFYVRFLLQDLSSGIIKIENLKSYPLSLDEYFEEQFRQLSMSMNVERASKIATQIVMSEIPVPKKELISMINGLNGWNFENTFNPIRRFFLNTEKGYIVCHNRFKDFFMKKLNNE